MPITSDILPVEDSDGIRRTPEADEETERAVMMPDVVSDPTFDEAPEVIDGVIKEIIVLDPYLEGATRPLISVSCTGTEAAFQLIRNIIADGFISVDFDIYPLHRISRFHIRKEQVTIQQELDAQSSPITNGE